MDGMKKGSHGNSSLRKSLLLYITAFTAVALVLCGITASACNRIQQAIYASHPPEGEQYYLTNEQGERLGEGTYISKTPRSLSSRDQQILVFLELIPIAATPIYSALCILAAAFLFYRNRLKEPLAELKRASEQISANNLDFTLPCARQDELGELCASFETMRLALRDSFSQLWRHMEERKRLNAAFAHDLRTPLTVLKGYDEMLQGASEDSTRAIAATMGKHITRMERYAESMSQLQRLEDLQPRIRTVPLQPLLLSIYESASIICGENGKTARLENRTRSTHLALDGALLWQVGGNLASNAARYAASLVTLTWEEREGGISLSVSDDGPGFRPDFLNRAARPYTTGEPADSDHFGLGLYICRLLCQHHGGWLRLENTTSGARVTAFFKIDSENQIKS